MNMLRGAVHKIGGGVDTDAIIASKYLQTTDPAELGKHCLEGLAPEFARNVQPGDILVAGEDFGIGSSREQAVLAIKGCGISCVVAVSFARLFVRNAINAGLRVAECSAAWTQSEAGDSMEIDFESGVVRNLSTGGSYGIAPYPQFITNIVESGGLVPYARDKLARGGSKVFS